MKPEPIAFHCPACKRSRVNPMAAKPTDGYASVYNHSEPRMCDDCVGFGLEQAFIARPRYYSTPISADEHRADLETLSGAISFAEVVEMYHPGMLKDKP